MVRASWLVLIGALLLALEVLLGDWAIIFPASLFATFYLALAFGMRRGMVCGLVLAVVGEILQGRSTTVVPLFLPLFFFLVIYRRFGDRGSVINHAVSGLGLAAANAAYLLVLENIHFRHGWSLLSGPSAIRLFLTSAIAGMLLIPFLIQLLDFLAERLEIERFTVQTVGVR